MTPLPDPATVPPHRPSAAEDKTAGPKSRFTLRPIGDAKALPTRRWLVDGLLPEEALVVMFGKSGAFKSLLALALACSVATGSPWIGRQTVKGLAIYVAGEGRSGLRYRAAAWEQEHSIKSAVVLGLMPGDFNFARTGDTDDLIARIKAASQDAKLPAKIIVFDTLSNAIPGQDENLQSVMSHVVADCNRIISETGAAVVCVHHPSKSNANDLRGNNVLEGRADTILQVKKEGKSCSVEVKKQRDGPSGTHFQLRLKEVQLEIEDKATEISYVLKLVADAEPSPSQEAFLKPKSTKSSGRALLALFQGMATPADQYRRASNGDTDFSVPTTRAREAAYVQLYSDAPTLEAKKKRFQRDLDALKEVVRRDRAGNLLVPFAGERTCGDTPNPVT